MSAARFPNGLEHRAAVELRASGRRLEGYAACFDAPAQIGGFVEVIRPGAFRAALLTKADVLALVDHDPGRLLARTSSGTLRLEEDAKGLHFEVDMPTTQLACDVLALAERRDLGGMSFGFRVKDEAWPARDRRELRAVDLVEISVVTAFPAYTQTTVSARARSMNHSDTLARLRRAMMEAL
ncbi:HK97 family phage prohead protease [Roseomonas sp. KE0001]|uniref:HK97 family phage prohead protease n=1 Tax=Roseomonas sp. KE0001 TaxID=2479201 RepID=UPI0018DFA216|nr:HK97 family phage prohead protease [Roseomonas sp. KE0001]MBI0432809.1 HK97 family phage prohead protease [Roseomonas sp. KE0001]